MLNTPKITIIVAVKNQAAALRRTLLSIQAQDYANLEVVVIDGDSTDNTVEIIREFADAKPSKIQYKYISEPDKGISDAFNKGINLATGEYINVQGAGDTLYCSTTISQMFNGLTLRPLLYCGKIIRVKEDGVTPVWVAPKKIRPIFNKRILLFRMGLPHQGLFMHRKYFEKFGGYDVHVKYAMDYELLLRSYKDFPHTLLRDIIVARWCQGGVGKDNIYKVLAEYHRIKTKLKIAPKPILSAINQYNRFKYFAKSQLLRIDD